MDRSIRAYIFVSTLAMAVLPWFIIGTIVGTEDIPWWLSTGASVVAISSIILGILVDNKLYNERDYNENAIHMLQESRRGLIQDLEAAVGFKA